MMGEKNRNMQVVLRVRPLSRTEMEQNQRNIIRTADSHTIIFDPDQDEDDFYFHGARQTHRDITKRVNKNLTMTFDQVFDNQSTNLDIFEFSMRPLVLSVMQGYNCSAFVYGATGAGKTYTMLGNEENPGITYLTMKELFDQIETYRDERKFDIGISYLEVYNEQVMNLLTKTGPLKLREDSSGVIVGGLQLKPIHNADELLSLLALGNRNRTQHPTDANAESSRSHAIFQVHIRMTNKKTGEKRTVKLSMIDLAGSERGSSTKCIGLRFKEGASINKSLLALGNCINKLADGSKHIPYRDSNMTRILKDSLGGNCQTVMIANISPSSLTYEDTYNTLKYASRAQKIRTTTLTKNVFKTNLPKEYYVRKLTDSVAETEQLQKRIKVLESQLAANQCQSAQLNNNNNSQSSFENVIKEVLDWQQKIDKTYDELYVAQDNYFSLQSKEKLLKFRTKLKEYTEETRKIFNMDGEFLMRDIARAEASIGKFSMQMDGLQADKTRWLQLCKTALHEVEEIKKKIVDNKINIMLQPYLKHKESELQKARLQSISDHYFKIMQIYGVETENTRKTIKLSGEILQEAYLVLSANLLLTTEMQKKCNQLYKIHDGQRGVKFTDADENSNDHTEPSTHPQFDDYGLENENEMTAKLPTTELPVLTLPKAKRALDIDEDMYSMPKRFACSAVSKDQINIMNATQVLETHCNEDITIDSHHEKLSIADTTVVIEPATKMLPPKRPAITITRALKETNANVKKEFAMPRSVVGKSILKSKATLGVPKEKENKRTPIKIRMVSKRNSPSNALNKILHINRSSAKPTDVVLKRLKEGPVRAKTFGK